MVRTREARVKLVVCGTKLIAIKVTPGAARLLRKAAPPNEVGTLGVIVNDARARFLLCQDDPHTPRESPLQVGAWLGVRVFVDIRGVLEAREANGSGDA